jgi:hypothetical protein
MKLKAALLALGLLLLAGPVHGQGGNTVIIRFPGAPSGTCAPLSLGINNATGALYDCVAGAWSLVGGGGAGVPGGAAGTVQYNNAGAFGGITGSSFDGTNVDFSNAGTTLTCEAYFCIRGEGEGTRQGFPALLDLLQESDNDWLFNFGNADAAAGVSTVGFQAAAGTFSMNTVLAGGTSGNLTLGAASGVQSTVGGETALIVMDPATRVSQVSRLTAGSNISGLVAGNFALSAGWGTTATVTSQGGFDNNFQVTATSAGTGQAANPTIIFTYADGDFNVASAAFPNFVCAQIGGTGIVADLTVLGAQTTVTLTWNATPTATLTYQFDCIGMQRN